MAIEMQKIVIDMTNEETYRDSLSELFQYEEGILQQSFDKHYDFGVGVNISEIVKDAMLMTGNDVYKFELHDLGDKKVLLIVAYAEG